MKKKKLLVAMMLLLDGEGNKHVKRTEMLDAAMGV